MRSGAVTGWMVVLSAVLGMPAAVEAAVLYSQNFEPPVPLSSTAQAFGGFGQINNISGTGWQVQGGGGGGGISVVTGIGNDGVGPSQGLFVNADHSAASSFTFNQYTFYGIPGPGAGVLPSQIQVELDLFMSGSESSTTPIGVVFQGNAGAVERTFTPTLTNDAYTHVVFTVDQAAGGAFDPTQSFNLRVQHGAGGFGFDNNNVVRFDNIVIQTIPEPATLALVGMAIAGMAAFGRRRGS